MMKKSLLLIVLLSFFGGWLHVDAQDKGTLVKVGDMAPEFEVKMFDGKMVKIKELKGKVVLINFWATWCGPCRQELTRVQKEIVDRFDGKDFVFLAISREDTYEQVKQFREQNGYAFPMGLDANREVFSKFATASIPRNFIVGKEGKILYSSIGYSTESFAELIQKLETFLEK